MKRILTITGIATALALCGACKAGGNNASTETVPAEETLQPAAFNADSAYNFVEKMVAFGPRVPNTEAHRKAGDWIVETMKGYGLPVTEQTAVVTAFDGTRLNMRNIFVRTNPDATDRILLLAHWDCRPWADQDPDPAKRKQPVDGANDGASGVGVLMEIARQLALNPASRGVDILFVDAEDWGDEGDDTSWALGARYFAENPPLEGYRPNGAILLDMVGSPDAQFGFEYFSEKSAPQLLYELWGTAGMLGHDNYFRNGYGGAVTDDHSELIRHGIPAIDIIDYRPDPDGTGFDPVWHTTRDNMDNISPATLRAVGETVLTYIRK